MKSRAGTRLASSRSRIWLILTSVGMFALLICLYFLIARGMLLWSSGAAVAVVFTAFAGSRWQKSKN